MTKALRKNTRRSISGSLGRYIAILLIIMLGVAFLTGLRDTRPIMSATETAYVKNTKLYDLRLISTIGFDYPKGLLYTFGYSLAAGVLLALLGKAFSPKAGRIIVTALWGIFSIFYMGQVVYYAIFKVYFTLFSVGGAGQVAQFSSVIFSTAEN